MCTFDAYSGACKFSLEYLIAKKGLLYSHNGGYIVIRLLNTVSYASRSIEIICDF